MTKADPEWKDAVAQARAAGRHVLAERLLDPDEYPLDTGAAAPWTRSVQWYLERLDRETYGNRVDVNHNVRVDLSVRLDGIKGREREMIEKRKRELEAIATTATRSIPEGVPVHPGEDEEDDE